MERGFLKPKNIFQIFKIPQTGGETLKWFVLDRIPEVWSAWTHLPLHASSRMYSRPWGFDQEKKDTHHPSRQALWTSGIRSRERLEARRHTNEHKPAWIQIDEIPVPRGLPSHPKSTKTHSSVPFETQYFQFLKNLSTYFSDFFLQKQLFWKILQENLKFLYFSD